MKENSTPKTTSNYQIAQPLLLSMMVAFGIFLGYKMNDKSDGYLISKVSSEEGSAYIGKVDEVLKFIESKYVDEIDPEELEDIAIETILSDLDPHSVYIKNEMLGSVVDNMNGSYYGLGIETIMQDDTVVIVRILKDSPAEKAGLKRYDKIIKIDSSLVAGKKGNTLDDVRTLLKSKKATFKINIYRSLNKSNFTVNLKSEKIKVYNADIHVKLDETTGLVKINQFSADTYKEFMSSLDDLTKDGKLRNLIIDLRGNPGGYLPEATKIINQLIIEGDKMIVSTVGRSGNKRSYKTNGKAFYDIPNIAILVDEESASGSEIIAGCIQDWDRGVIIGRKTFGKGLVQEQFNLSDGSALRLTTSKYYLPSGRNIQRNYEDPIKYHDSNYQRMKDSTLFVDKTRNLKHSTSEYKSLSYGRFLSKNDGIDPDIFIPLEGDVYEESFIQLSSMIYPFGVKLLSSHTLTDQALNNKVNLYDNFVKYCISKDSTITLNSFKPKYKSLLNNKLVKDLKALKSDNNTPDYEGDPFVSTAIDYFKNPGIAKLKK